MKQKATSFDIAFRAGVSQATVSRALRNSPLVSPETRRKVLQVAKELNYKVDKNASSLRRQRASTLALLLFEDASGDASRINPFFLTLLGTITRAAARAGHDLLVSFQQQADDWHAEYQDSHRADGLILLGYGDYLAYSGKLERLVRDGTHFVRWGSLVEDQHGASIGCDNRQAGRLVGEHLAGLGRRRVAFVGTASLRCPEFLERYEGCMDALAAHGLARDASLCEDADDSTEDLGRAAIERLLARGADFDAVFCGSDLLAIGAMQALEAAGRRVPEDVAVVGFDDIPAAAYARPPLTTVVQDTHAAGEALVQNVIAQIRGEAPRSEMLPARLVIRRSCGATP